MPLLLKLTTDYLENEDRLRLVGQDDGGHVYQLWLTRRLADRLFHSVLDWLKKQNAVHVGSDLFQTFEQDRAVGKIEPLNRVNASSGDGTSSWLINNIDITRGDEAIVLVFKSAGDQEASFALRTKELRQWLSICCKGYQKAEWPMDVWPSWMIDYQEPDMLPATALVH